MIPQRDTARRPAALDQTTPLPEVAPIEMDALFVTSVDARAALVQAETAERAGAMEKSHHYRRVARRYAEELAQRTHKLPLMFEASPFLREAWMLARQRLGEKATGANGICPVGLHNSQ